MKKKRNKYEVKKNMKNRGRAAKNSPSKINAKKIFEDILSRYAGMTCFAIALLLIAGAFMGIEPLNESTMKVFLYTKHHRPSPYIYVYPFELFWGLAYFFYAIYCTDEVKNKWVRRIVFFTFLPIGLLIRTALDKTFGYDPSTEVLFISIYMQVIVDAIGIYFIIGDKLSKDKSE